MVMEPVINLFCNENNVNDDIFHEGQANNNRSNPLPYNSNQAQGGSPYDPTMHVPLVAENTVPYSQEVRCVAANSNNNNSNVKRQNKRASARGFYKKKKLVKFEDVSSVQKDGQQQTQIVTVRSDFVMRCRFEDHFTAKALITDQNKPAMVVNHFRAQNYDPWKLKMSEGARRIFYEPNAGGNSEWSEAFSFEILNTLYGAQLICTGKRRNEKVVILIFFDCDCFVLCVLEMEINYWPLGGKITDYSVKLFGQLIGVSVTRALRFKAVFTEEDAFTLLSKKLNGINVSSRLVVDSHKWSKQMLHVWAANENVAKMLEKVWHKLDSSLTSNTFMLITVTEENTDFIYRNNFSLKS